MEKAPPEMKKYFKMIRDAVDTYMVRGKWKTFEKDNLPIAGIKAVPIPGHTAGHCGFEISSDNKTLLIIGDMVHNITIQFAYPDAAISFDKDQKGASPQERQFSSASP